MSLRNLRILTIAIALGAVVGACGAKSGKSQNDGPDAPDGGVELEGATWSDAQGFQLVPTWEEGPAANAWSRVELALFDAAGEPAPQVDITTVKPWMSVHGHGAPVKKMTVTRDGATHVWLVDKLWFTMSGEWEIIVTAKVPNAPFAEQVVELKVAVP